MAKILCSALAFWPLLLALACSGSAPEPAAEAELPAQPQALKAVAELQPTEGSTVQGTVSFEESGGMVHINATITGLTPGKHGFHIHETGDCSAPDASSAGGHFNPDGSPHGGPHDAEHHAGDLGNIEADENGTAEVHIMVDFITLSEGPNSVVGRAVIVHAQEDDLTSQPTGAAGGRLACGVITLQ